LAPVALFILGFLFSHSFLLAFFCGVAGLALPTLVLRIMETRRNSLFQRQLVDGLMILSSSLKAGLSLLQALEVLVEEMPAPISEEFGLIVRENKMGVALEQSLLRLNQRMKIEELGLLINAILVARETGGDLTRVFNRLAVTIRDNRKLRESIQTLTMQGRLQGWIMSLLPIVFVAWVYNFNRHHFEIMFNTPTGRFLLLLALALQLVGIFLIKKFSTVRV
jgi:tight adherence protein B